MKKDFVSTAIAAVLALSASAALAAGVDGRMSLRAQAAITSSMLRKSLGTSHRRSGTLVTLSARDEFP